MNPVLRAARELAASIMDHEILDRAALMAYYQLFAILPLTVAGLGVLSWLDWGEELRLLEDVLASSPVSISGPILQEANHLAGANAQGRVILGLLAAIYSGSRAMNATIRGVNAAWGRREERHTLVVNGIGLALTLGVGVAVLGVLGLVTGGKTALDLAARQGWLEPVEADLLQSFRWPFILLMVHSTINNVYRLGANTPLKRWALSTWGAVLATLGFVVCSWGFELYVRNWQDFGATYGSLGIAIGLLSWFYLLACSVLLGAEIDAMLFRWRLEHRSRTPERR